MTAGTDAYLERVARRLAGMDRRVRGDILRELRSHVSDAVATQGEAVLASLDSPKTVAARYRELYGYGATYRVLFVAFAAVLAVPTVPVLLYAGLGVPGALAAALAFLLGLVAYLLFAAMRAGSRTGTAAGIAAFVARLAVVVALEAPAAYVVPDAVGWVTFLAVSAGLVVLGYLPGRVKERWKPPDVTM